MKVIGCRAGHAVIAGMVAAGVLGVCGTAEAARRGKGGGQQQQPQQQQQQQPQTPTDSGTSGGIGPVPAGSSALDIATKAATQAQADYDAFVAAQQKVFDQSADALAAQQAVDKSAAALEALMAPIREKLKASNDSYARALDDIVLEKQKLAEATAAKKHDDVVLHRSGVNYYQEIITKAEAPVIADNKAVRVAQKQLDADKEKLAALPAKFQATLAANPDFQALSTALANAKSRLTLAQGGPANQ